RPVRHHRWLGAAPARLPPVHGPRDDRAREQPGGGGDPVAFSADTALSAYPGCAAALPRPAGGAPAAARVARRRGRRARRRGDGLRLRRRPADRERPVGAAVGALHVGQPRARGRLRADPAARHRGAGTVPAVSAPAIAVRRLTVTYAGATRPALAGLDWEIPTGALAVVMGATGAGKS